MAAGGDMIDDEALVQSMHQMNPWWKTGSLPPAMRRPFRMRDYGDMVERLDKWPVQSILGARQVGKTTLLYQLIDHLVSSGTDPRRVLFLSFDAQGMVPDAGHMLRLFEVYARDVLGESVHDLGGRIYAVLDEVHLVDNWQRLAKNFVD